MRLFITLLLFLLLNVGCASHSDLYDRMNNASKPAPGLQQTQLAHIGHVDTRDGRYEVCVQRLVLTDMLAPRGQMHLLIFDGGGRLIKNYYYPCFENEPLWCEGGRVYLFGFAYIPEISPEAVTGNVIDFTSGISNARFLRENKYGSSGGTGDLPPN